MTEVVIGVDPGVTGALAVIEVATGAVAALERVKAVENGFGGRVKRHVDPAGTAAVIEQALAGSDVRAVCIERVGPRDRQPATTFSLGDSFGVMRALLAPYDPNPMMPLPQDWQPRNPWSKDESRALASQVFPGAAGRLGTSSAHDLADALLLAEHCRRVVTGSDYLLEGVDTSQYPV